MTLVVGQELVIVVNAKGSEMPDAKGTLHVSSTNNVDLHLLLAALATRCIDVIAIAQDRASPLEFDSEEARPRATGFSKPTERPVASHLRSWCPESLPLGIGARSTLCTHVSASSASICSKDSPSDPTPDNGM